MTMTLPSDLKEFSRLLDEKDVKYVIVGGLSDTTDIRVRPGTLGVGRIDRRKR